MKLKKILNTLFIFIIFCLVVFWLFNQGYLRFNYPSRKKYPVWGVDVSHHQGKVNWQKIKQEGFDFAFIKATEGGDFVDHRFNENWKLSKEAGVFRGAYHFFTFCRPGADQAANFLQNVPTEGDALPIVLDLEFGGNCKKIPDHESLFIEVNSFLNAIKEKFPKIPILYVTQEFYEYYMSQRIEKFPRHHLWLRDIFSEPKQSSCVEWRIWQFSNRGRVQGINSFVDLNVFCGDKDEFMKLFLPSI